MQLNINQLDCIFLSYDEPNAEELYADLQNKMPWAKRVSGVKGFDSAHRACADASDTEFFVTVDGDNLVHPEFMSACIDIEDSMTDHAWSWSGKNAVNGLVYGNGGLKLWSKQFVRNMNSHEHATNSRDAVDFCWNSKYHDAPGCYSTSVINATPYQAFRSGFREGVKMCLDRGDKVDAADFLDRIWGSNLTKLRIWCSVGADVENGSWAVYGARLGAHMCNFGSLDTAVIGDYDWMASLWTDVSSRDCATESVSLGNELNKRLGLDIADLDATQSKFFKSLYQATR